ncbi:uncharacterized protein LOC144981306 [Oryzias latipes]
MLIKTKINNDQKYVKISEPSLEEFLNSAFLKFSIPPVSEGVRVYDESGTEVDAEVFAEVAQLPNAGVFTIQFNSGSLVPILTASTQDLTSSQQNVSSCSSNNTVVLELSVCDSDDTIILDEDCFPSRKRQKTNEDAKQVVELALTKKPGGDQIVREYSRTKSLTDSSRRQMINILAADMTEIHGMAPPRHVREMYARGIVQMFPYLMDPFSKNGYEHFYDPESGTGYLAWRLKTIQRNSSSQSRRTPHQLAGGGPLARRNASFQSEITLTEEQCKEAISFMKYSSDEDIIKQKMKMTFEYRHNMVHSKDKSSDVLTEFPCFKDIKGLIEQDFILQFRDEVAAKFLERWPTVFKQKDIQQSKALPSSSNLEDLIYCAEATSLQEEDDIIASGWDSDLSSVILLLHLIPPTAQGRKRPGKVSASQAEKHLVVFKKSGTSIQEHVDAVANTTQPYLLAIGTKKSRVQDFFIVLDKQVIPCKSTSSLGAVDELFKAHFVFGTLYSQMLHNMYTFIQTTVYNIDVAQVQESPRVAEIRARILQSTD